MLRRGLMSTQKISATALLRWGAINAECFWNLTACGVGDMTYENIRHKEFAPPCFFGALMMGVLIMSNVYSEAKREPGSNIGWNWTPKSIKWHYFVNGHALCDEWLRIEHCIGKNCDNDPLTDNSLDNCADCQDEVAKMRKAKRKGE